MYPAPEGSPRVVGVINLTDRLGTDAFTQTERRLVSAIAGQIAAAIENARLVERDRQQMQVRRELELAHDLQLRLLPRPASVGMAATIGARCEPAESVGGDFYEFLRLSDRKVGVMLGDVSSHGFGAALIMALTLSAAGIHAASSATPEETLTRLLESISAELSRTEMHLAIFYAVIDPERGRIHYANAGHPHAFRLNGSGSAERLGATSAPLGLARSDTIKGADAPWKPGSDLLILVSDGIIDARNQAGEKFGETRLLDLVRKHRALPPGDLVNAVFAEVTAHAPARADDRTLLVLHG
jgi:sigma-B regulation protein RsbU (phosphoserine phosphatase)